jgi:hypothetical protein
VLRAHPVFVTKYRRPVFTGTMLSFCELVTHGICAQLARPISTPAQRLKGRAAHTVRPGIHRRFVRARVRDTAKAHRCRLSSNTSTAKRGHAQRAGHARARRDRLYPTA